ncbi:unnamed protein product [Arabidopsis lyrata]|uniref:Uncharacterized protein n=1 Tax=Arabidopsis lyrata subsp. lyrata TaxID=81972 RepID=D7KL11_ARALL|nr:uncharacterized protein LOC9327205 [Arabidopsis lyrata subsp. lyrata]EFH67402.1 hypothetical protein ARALYDRAFT_891118 [Arabidopsis lyrata subsp. lyrata]CAH8254436.1 unnamed protein product [Arabidopsis lyrata]|eukprot:XP_002891143.1 uncharacterized protein LOC9327205 [Arabidopsis lyrata subsp. lyrata]
MADFGYFSDTDDSAVEELISQAKELSALEQVAAINCSGFTDSTLPDDLESRFRRLKSLPAAPRHEPVSSSSSMNRKNHLTHSKSVATNHPKEDVKFSGNPGKKPGSVSLSDEDSRNKRDLEMKSSSQAELVSNGSGDFSDSGNISESKIFSPVKQQMKKKLPKEKRRIVSPSSSSSIDLATTPPSTDSEPEKKSKSKSKSSWFDKLSPSKLIGTIWRSSPRKSTTNKKNLKSIKSFNTAAYTSGRERKVDFDEFLSDLNAFPVEDQRKMLKKALKEQQKMRKEAAEIIKMAKQASARFDFDD